MSKVAKKRLKHSFDYLYNFFNCLQILSCLPEFAYFLGSLICVNSSVPSAHYTLFLLYFSLNFYWYYMPIICCLPCITPTTSLYPASRIQFIACSKPMDISSGAWASMLMVTGTWCWYNIFIIPAEG